MTYYIGVSESEGGYWMREKVNAIDLPDITKTGEVNGRKVAAVMYGEGIVYDFVLKAKGLCPVRYHGG